VENEIVAVQLYILCTYLIQLLILHHSREDLVAICDHFSKIEPSAPANDEPNADYDDTIQWEAEKRATIRMPKLMGTMFSLAQHGTATEIG
jgi:hypothetical protein